MKHIFLINISKYLVIFFPLFLISGPFFTDFSGTIIGIFTMLFIFLKKKNEYIHNKYFYFFIIIFFYINLSSLFAEFPLVSLKSSVSYLRLILFIFAISFLVNYFQDLPIKIYQIYFLSLFLLLIDSLLIMNFNLNIFGQQVDGSSSRIKSLFGDEEIMGSFISRTLPLIIGLSYYFTNKNNTKFNLFLIFIASFLILISGERTALGNFLIFLFFYIMLERKLIIRILFLLTIIFLIVLSTKKESIERNFNHTINQSTIESNKIIVFSLRHTLHYFTAYEIFKDFPYLGSGIKSFRELCSKAEYVEKLNKFYKKNMSDSRLTDGCNTHPHNIYMQFLSEIGIIGFLLFLSIFIFITYNIYVLLRKSFLNNVSRRDKSIYFILVAIFISMFPFLPSGNYFNNWFIFINYFPIGFYLANKITK